MGGQNGDKGEIVCEAGRFVVEDTIHLLGGKIGHVGYLAEGMMKVGDRVTLKVDEVYRKNICKNHSATHLLQKALKTVLGSHVEQKGSLVTPDRLRFDFAHFQAMTPEEIEKVEAIVNEEIAGSASGCRQKIMSIRGCEEDRRDGTVRMRSTATKVRVVCMGDFSRELCGGTHVANTSADRDTSRSFPRQVLQRA